MKLYITLAFLLIVPLLNAQNETRVEITEMGIFSKDDYSQAKVYFNQEAVLNDIIISKKGTKKRQQVWRVQIYMGSGRNARAAATSTRNSFVAKYADIDAEMVYPSPYWKVLVGVFKTRIEAESLRKKLLGEYPKSRVELVTIENDD